MRRCLAPSLALIVTIALASQVLAQAPASLGMQPPPQMMIGKITQIIPGGQTQVPPPLTPPLTPPLKPIPVKPQQQGGWPMIVVVPLGTPQIQTQQGFPVKPGPKQPMGALSFCVTPQTMILGGGKGKPLPPTQWGKDLPGAKTPSLTTVPPTVTPPFSSVTPPPSIVTPPPSIVTPPPSIVTPPPSIVTPPPSTLTPPPSTLTPPPSTLTPPPTTLTPPIVPPSQGQIPVKPPVKPPIIPPPSQGQIPVKPPLTPPIVPPSQGQIPVKPPLTPPLIPPTQSQIPVKPPLIPPTQSQIPVKPPIGPPGKPPIIPPGKPPVGQFGPGPMIGQLSVGQMVQVSYTPGQGGLASPPGTATFQATQIKILPQVGPVIPGPGGAAPFGATPGTNVPPAPPAPGGSGSPF